MVIQLDQRQNTLRPLFDYSAATSPNGFLGRRMAETHNTKLGHSLLVGRRNGHVMKCQYINCQMWWNECVKLWKIQIQCVEYYPPTKMKVENHPFEDEAHLPKASNAHFHCFATGRVFVTICIYTYPPGNDHISHLWEIKHHLETYLEWGYDCSQQGIPTTFPHAMSRRAGWNVQLRS